MTISPLARKQWHRFKSIKRGYYAALALAGLLVMSCAAEMLVNNRALIVKYEGEYYFPTYGAYLPGDAFGLDYQYEANYRELAQMFAAQRSAAEQSGGQRSGNWVLMPPVRLRETQEQEEQR